MMHCEAFGGTVKAFQAMYMYQSKTTAVTV